MKLIPLTRGENAMVDDEDFKRVNQFKWHLRIQKKTGLKYAIRSLWCGGKYKKIYMHQFVLGIAKVDHRDGNGINNQRFNLRECSKAENNRNRRIGRDNTSGFKGVCYHKRARLWQSQIYVNNKARFLGLFESPKEAAFIYDAAAKKFHGEFSKTNQQLGLLT